MRSVRSSAGPRIARRPSAPTWTPLSPPLATSTADCTATSLAETATPPKLGLDVQWTKCPSCDAFVYYKRLKRNFGVCPECNHHFRIPVRARLDQLLDQGSFEDLSGDLEPLDVIGFADSKPYAQRIAEAQRKTGSQEGITYGTATIGGHPLVVAVMDFAFVGGSMGGAVGEGVARAAELALERRTPLLVICASGGARMQEGCVSLMQMAKTSAAFARLHEDGRARPLPAHRSDLRRGDRLVRHARRRAHRRAGRTSASPARR